ncbi:MAG: DegV family protein [Erysipelotrichaceae bacterium]|nr:DegV family protein [Erysipelotrichaceae bacterium]
MRIVADSSCDLYSLDFEDFKTVPLKVYTTEKSFNDDPDLDIGSMLDYLEKYNGRSFTSCPSIDAWLETFEGADEVFAITITSALSGSYNSAVNAAAIYKEENPNAKVSVIDSLSTGAEEILAIFKLKELISQGLSFKTIDVKIREYIRKSRLFFSFYSLHNLAQNGRVNKTVAGVMNVLNIVITGTASQEGKIDVTGRTRGEKKSIQVLINDMKNAGYAGGKAIITHVQNETAANNLKQEVLKLYPDADIKIFPARGLCSYYMERKGVVISCETQ